MTRSLTPEISENLLLNWRAMANRRLSSLERLSASRVVADEVAELQVALVLAARAPGTSWSVIGKRLGISKQAAHQRFGTRIA